MRHEPAGLEGDANGSVKLVAADALLAPGEQIHCLKPDAQRDVRCLKDGADPARFKERVGKLVKHKKAARPE